jgi:uncharacterized damage-inducible protein DinB
VALKTDGLDEPSARRSTVPSGTSVLGLVKHLTAVEQLWFQYSFAGREVDLSSDALEPTDTIESVVAAHRETYLANDAIVSACDDLDRLCERALTTPEPLSLRWVLVHMVDETARHAGHADIIREQLDGATGR